MQKKISLLLVFHIVAITVSAQSLWNNPITNANPSLYNPFTIGDQVVPGLTVSGIGRGPGINANTGTDRYNANGWNTSTLDPDAYFSFTLTPPAGKAINFTTATITAQKSGSGPTTATVRSSVDNFSNDIASMNLSENAATVELDMSSFQNITIPISFRIYGYGATAANGTASINDFQFNGNITDPATMAVHFGSLEADRKGNAINVKWDTKEETNNDHFEIEASKDGQNFTPVATVASRAPNGNSDKAISYQYTVQYQSFFAVGLFAFLMFLTKGMGRKKSSLIALAGMVIIIISMSACSKSKSDVDLNAKDAFIRIKQIDKNGNFGYSKVVKIVK